MSGKLKNACDKMSQDGMDDEQEDSTDDDAESNVIDDMMMKMM